MIIVFLNIFLLFFVLCENKISKKIKFNLAILTSTLYFFIYELLKKKENVDLIYYRKSFLNKFNGVQDFRIEVGYKKLSILFSELGFNFQMFHFFIYMFILIVFVYFAYKRTGKIFLPLSLFLSFYGIYFSQVTLRIGIATAIIVLFYDRKILKYFSILIAMLFHKTAAIYFLLLIIPKKLFKKKVYYLIIFVNALIYYLHLGKNIYDAFFVLFTKYFKTYSYYLSSSETLDGFSIRFFSWNIIIVILLLIVDYKKIPNPKDFSRFLNFYIVGLTVYSLLGFFYTVDRIGDLFFVFQYLVVTELCNAIKSKYKNFKLIILVLIVLNTIFIIRFARL